MVLVATPIMQSAFAAVNFRGVGNWIFAIAFAVVGALKRFAVPETGNTAAVPVPQFDPVPC